MEEYDLIMFDMETIEHPRDLEDILLHLDCGMADFPEDYFDKLLASRLAEITDDEKQRTIEIFNILIKWRKESEESHSRHERG